MSNADEIRDMLKKKSNNALIRALKMVENLPEEQRNRVIAELNAKYGEK